MSARDDFGAAIWNNVRTGFFDDDMIAAVRAQLPKARAADRHVRVREWLAGAERNSAARVVPR
jgi:hypothetical protein